MTPQDFKTELLEFIISSGFYPQISPWQIDIADRIMNDFALITGQSVSLDISKSCPAPTTCAPAGWGAKAKQEEVNPMASYASAQIIADTTERDQRSYARDRIRAIRSEKLEAFRKQFGLIDDEAPETIADALKRIADGKFTYDEKKKDYKTYDPMRYIRWRDPSVKEDHEGYNAAEKALGDAYTKAKDKMVLGQISELEAAIDTFAAFTI